MINVLAQAHRPKGLQRVLLPRACQSRPLLVSIDITCISLHLATATCTAGRSPALAYHAPHNAQAKCSY